MTECSDWRRRSPQVNTSRPEPQNQQRAGGFPPPEFSHPDLPCSFSRGRNTYGQMWAKKESDNENARSQRRMTTLMKIQVNIHL